MFKKTVLYIIRFLLTFFSALILITTAGYYIFYFYWDISVMGNIVNAVLIFVAIAASIAFYAVAEKIK